MHIHTTHWLKRVAFIPLSEVMHIKHRHTRTTWL